MPSYKLTFGDRVLTYLGWNGQAGWKSMTAWSTNMWSQGNIHSIYGVNRISDNQ